MPQLATVHLPPWHDQPSDEDRLEGLPPPCGHHSPREAFARPDEFRRLLVADVEALLDEHHARLTEHLEKVSARQQEVLGQLGKAGTSSNTSSNFRKEAEHSSPKLSFKARPSLAPITETAGDDREEQSTARPITVRTYTDSVLARQTNARTMMARQNGGSSTKRLRSFAPGWRGALQRLAGSTAFETVTCCLIISNAIFIGMEVQYVASEQVLQPPTPFKVGSLIYTILFTAELLIRFLAEPIYFFCAPTTYLWNLLDSVIVAVSLIELLLASFEGTATGGANKLTYVRIIRMARTVRIFRIMRILKDFASLRILLYCVLTTLRSLIWTLLLLAIIMYVFGIMFTQASSDFVVEQPESEVAESVRQSWGSLWISAYTLFKAVTGGVSWQEVSTPLGIVHPFMEAIFLIYISFTYFAVLNVVTGVFCQSAMESANHDKDMVVQAQMANKQKYKKQLEEIFQSMDQDDTGLLTFTMFEDALLNEDNQLRHYLDGMGITPDDAWNLFRLMDIDESQDIDMEEFVGACLRLRGSARAVDSHLLMYESRWTMRKVMEVHHMLNDLIAAMGGNRPARRPQASLISSGPWAGIPPHYESDQPSRSSFTSGKSGTREISFEAADSVNSHAGRPMNGVKSTNSEEASEKCSSPLSSNGSPLTGSLPLARSREDSPDAGPASEENNWAWTTQDGQRSDSGSFRI